MNLIKKLGIIAVIAIIAFAMTACPPGDDGLSVSNSTAPLGATLTLTGQVQTGALDFLAGNIGWTNYTSTLTLNSSFATEASLTGTITSGNVALSAATPTTLYDIDYFLEYLEYDEFTNVIASDDSAQIYWMEELILTGSDDLARGNAIASMSNTSMSVTAEMFIYIYVDRNVTITADGFKDSYSYMGVSFNDKLYNLNITLQEGWNAVVMKVIMTMGEASMSTEASMYAANPAGYRWILGELDMSALLVNITHNSFNMGRNLLPNMRLNRQ